MYPKTSEGLNQETDKQIFFFTPAFHPFDNFSAHAVEIWGKVFFTAEQAYQWKKFSHDEKIAQLILDTRSPEAANQIGHTYKEKMPPDWHDRKVEVMKEILSAKLNQHEDVRQALLRSGAREIVENSPVDNFWGNGPQKNGQNMMGKIWMGLRKEFIK